MARVQNRPNFSLSRVDVPEVGAVFLDFADRQMRQNQIGLDNAMQQAKMEEDRRRYETELDFKQKQEQRAVDEIKRTQKERAAQDAYAESIAAGPQSISFAGTDVNKILDSYKTGKNKYDDAKLEQFAHDHIAAVQSGKLAESRSDMLKRTADDIRRKGLPVPMQLVQAYDQARLAEMEALKAKDASLSERIKALQNQELDMAKWMVQQQSKSDASGSADDSSGPSQKANDKTGTAVVGLMKNIRELPANKQAGVMTDAIKLFNDAKALYPNLTAKEIEAAVATGLGSHDGWFSSPEATFKSDTAIKALEEMNKRFPAGTKREDVLGTDNARGNMAISLGELYSKQNTAELNRLLAERDALLKGPMSDRDRVNEWLNGRNKPTTPAVQTTSATPAAQAEAKKVEEDIKKIIEEPVTEDTETENTKTKEEQKETSAEKIDKLTELYKRLGGTGGSAGLHDDAKIRTQAEILSKELGIPSKKIIEDMRTKVRSDNLIKDRDAIIHKRMAKYEMDKLRNDPDIKKAYDKAWKEEAKRRGYVGTSVKPFSLDRFIQDNYSDRLKYN